jgi:hypothetical protein
MRASPQRSGQRPRPLYDAGMHRPWEKHLSTAIVLAAVAFAVGELWSPMAGAGIGAAAFFVALRPLFRNRRTRK